MYPWPLSLAVAADRFQLPLTPCCPKPSSPPEQEVVPCQHAAAHYLVEGLAARVGEHGLGGGVLGGPEAELDAVVARHVAGHLDSVQQRVDGDRVLCVRHTHLREGWSRDVSVKEDME